MVLPDVPRHPFRDAPETQSEFICRHARDGNDVHPVRIDGVRGAPEPESVLQIVEPEQHRRTERPDHAYSPPRGIRERSATDVRHGNRSEQFPILHSNQATTSWIEAGTYDAEGCRPRVPVGHRKPKRSSSRRSVARGEVVVVQQNDPFVVQSTRSLPSAIAPRSPAPMGDQDLERSTLRVSASIGHTPHKLTGGT